MATIHLTLAPLLLLLLVAGITAQRAAPAPGPAGPINITAILEKGGQFVTLIRLLNTTQIGSQINIQINSSTEGMTIFAPTDNAFQNLKPGTLNKLSSDDQVKLILYHVSPKFYTLDDLLSVSNPVRTQASGRDRGTVYGLNFTGQGNQVNVSTGMIETRVSTALRPERPLAVYVVDMVLLPEEMFGERKIVPVPAPSPQAKSPDVSDDVDSTRKAAAPTRPTSERSGSGEMKVGLGFGLGLVMLCLKFLI
ncbi:hypothetical protein AALP_AA6G142700 [Arabis alpina]|uniref:FAS1 domain-containing protein n=1 Tax=Arabis alpina TaxID=50452 RepID=A0A087GP61_ARAAL|nr:hypothetical protein AALP_AA6G142700 [Arabis alpina]